MEKPITAVICAMNSKYIHSSLATWYLAAAAAERCGEGVEVCVLEGTINDRPELLLKKIVAKTPDVVGFSCYIWNITAVLKLSRQIKSQLPDTVLVLGGPEVSYNSGQILREHPYIDYVVCGEGEKPFALLLNALHKGKPPENIPGLSRRAGSEILQSPPFIDDGDPPSPYGSEYFGALGNRIAYLETSRGCPYSCAFCLSCKSGGVRYFNLDRAKKELIMLANSGAKTVKLVDRTFNANKKRAAELVEFIISKYVADIPRGVCFHFEIAGDILDERLINLFCSAPPGLIQLEIGVQSFNQKTLIAVNRKTDLDRLTENVGRLVSSGNIHIHIDLIAGLPFEDFASFASSFNAAYKLKAHMLQLGFLKLLHGSPMREDSKRYPCRFSKSPPYEVIETPWLSEDGIKLLHCAEDSLNRLYNSGRFRRTLEYLLSTTGVPPFELFRRFGEYCAFMNIGRVSLDDYTSAVYRYFSEWDRIDREVLRDVLICDRLSTNPGGSLPPALKDESAKPQLKAVLKKMKDNRDTAPIKGVRRGAALLRAEKCVAYADYRDKNPVTGEFELKKYYY